MYSLNLSLENVTLLRTTGFLSTVMQSSLTISSMLSPSLMLTSGFYMYLKLLRVS